MSSGLRLYILNQLTSGERSLVERIEAEVKEIIESRPTDTLIEHPLPPHLSDAGARTLAEVFALAGWQAGLRRSNGLVLVLTRLVK